MKKTIKHIRFRHLWVLALSMCMILALIGCGQDDTTQMGAEPPSDAVQTETETEKTDKDAPSLEDVAVMPDETNAGRAQMEIDEETRKELTVELLEEHNLDTSVAERARATKGCTFDLPEGFAESEEVPGMYEGTLSSRCFYNLLCCHGRGHRFAVVDGRSVFRTDAGESSAGVWG